MDLFTFIYSLFHPGTIENESLEISFEIESLARVVLSPQEFEEAEQITKSIMSGGRRKKSAIALLQNRIGLKPKRPIYYITLEFLPRLPHYTRETMRYLGDYLDLLVKCVTYETKHNNIFMSRSMGSNLHSIKGVIPDDLQEQLLKYNNFIYVQAKHDFQVGARMHRFTCKEVVYAIAITLEFGKKLKALSPLARQYVSDK